MKDSHEKSGHPTQAKNSFCLSFLAGIRPFTAFCRVTDLHTARSFLAARRPQLSPRTLASIVGAIVGEATAYVRGTKLEPRVALKAFTSTLSFSVLKMFCLGIPLDLDRVGRAWTQARYLTKQQNLPMGLDEVRQPLDALLTVLETDHSRYEVQAGHIQDLPPDFGHFFGEYAETGNASEYSLRFINDYYPQLHDLASRMKDTREERIQYLEYALRELAQSRDRTSSSFVAGFLTSQVAPGTLDHLKMLQPFGASFPLSFMWYGVFAGLSEKTSILNFAEASARRVMRELTRVESLLDTPKCDIAVGELQVLSRDVSEPDFRSISSGHLEVEILPCIISSMRAAPRDSDIKQPQLFSQPPLPDDVLDTVADLDNAVERVVKAQQRLHRQLGLQFTKQKRKS